MDISVSSREEDAPRDEIVVAMLNSARSAMRLGMFEEAMRRLEEILEEGTTDIPLLGEIYMYYGRVCRYLKLGDKALTYFEHELSILKLTTAYPKACDSSRRIVELALSMGKFSKAKRCAEDLIDYTSNRKDGESFLRKARLLLASVCLDGYERNMESNPAENKKLLTVSTEQIAIVKELNKANSDNVSEIEIMMLEAKCLALEEKLKEAQNKYKECIQLSIKTDQLANVHRAYYEMSCYAEGKYLLFMINNIRSAIFYASKFGTEREAAKYKRELADMLLAFGNPHEAYFHGMEALELIRKLSLNEYLQHTLLIVAKCLASLGQRRQAAYFIVLGSILTVKQDDFEKFYNLVDEVMTAERRDASEGQEILLALDASTDTATTNKIVAKFVVKLEHATSIETWRMIVNNIIDEQKKPEVVEQKDNEEPVDFMDLICKMNSRMDDQRTAMPASMFAAPRPVSSQSKKTIKSHRILPGLRTNLAKIQSMKFDTQTVNRLLKRSKRSKTSLHSTSTQGDDTRSEDTTILSK